MRPLHVDVFASERVPGLLFLLTRDGHRPSGEDVECLTGIGCTQEFGANAAEDLSEATADELFDLLDSELESAN